jgi:hypothetical protein
MRRIPDRGPGAVLGYTFALAFAFCFFVVVLGIYLEWERPLGLGLVIGGGVGVVVAVWLVWGYNRFLWKVEEVSGGRLELTGDEWTGQPPIEREVKEVVRPVPVYGPWQHRQAQPPQPPVKSDEPTFKAPSGNLVTWEEMEDFASRAPVRGTTFTGYWREVYELAGYDDPHIHWQDVIDLWHIFGCCSERKERHKVKWLAQTHEAAMQALGTARANRPTP